MAAERFEDAADEYAETVRSLRKLAFARPAELERLGRGLMSQWLPLFKLRRSAEALVVAEENAAVWRILAENQYHRLYLAQALDMVEISRAMVGTDSVRPETDELLSLRADLAREANHKHAHSLTLVAEDHVEHSRYDAALPLLEQIVGIRRNLATADPGVRPKLVTALTELGHCLTDLGEHERARAAHAEALELESTLDAARPLSVVGLRLNLAGSLRELQRYDEAVGHDEVAVAILRDELHSHEKGGERLAWALSLLSEDLRASGRHDEARSVDDELARQQDPQAP
jgi:tetratricopeptide (TPR) repeat protein